MYLSYKEEQIPSLFAHIDSMFHGTPDGYFYVPTLGPATE